MRRNRGDGQRSMRLIKWQAKWLKGCHYVEDAMNAVGKEQFLLSAKKLWVLKPKPKTCVQAGELAEEYEQERQPETETMANSAPKPTRVGPHECQYYGQSSHAEEGCYKRKREVKEAEVLNVTTVKSKGTCHGNAQNEVWRARNGGTGDEQVADQCTRQAKWSDKRSLTFFLT